MAAEIPRDGRQVDVRRPGFNEAAANGRGNDVLWAARDGRIRASMRPRRMAAEMAGSSRRALLRPRLQ